jgi:hypothetical protein
MKRKQDHNEGISQGNTSEYRNYILQKKVPAEYSDFCLWLSEFTDAIAAGDNLWLTIGATRNRSALLFTLHDGDDVRYVAAGSFREIAKLVAESL